MVAQNWPGPTYTKILDPESTYKNGEVCPTHKDSIFLFDSQHVSAEIDYHQVISEKCTGRDGIL
jgi:hypothetical protein